MFKNIIIAVDGSAYSESVISHAAALSRLYHSRIFVFTVVDVRIFEWASAVGADGFVTIVPSGTFQEESIKLLEEKAEKILQKCGQLLEKEQIPFKLEKAVGSPAELILAKSQIADVVIMGKRGEFERWDNHDLGVTVQTVCRSIAKPLMVVKKEPRPIQRILLGYDGSEHANRALQQSAHLADTCQAKLTVVCVSDDLEAGTHYCQEAEEYLESYAGQVYTQVIAGEPSRQLVAYAQSQSMDLIVIGAFGRSRIRQAILGSTTEHILRFSTCPVLLVK
ncbi:MAG: Universal stress protein [bacterium ADurb.Bin478]|nr:MAG: Universal stress protein [bacterium ADurb.Bin478]